MRDGAEVDPVNARVFLLLGLACLPLAACSGAAPGEVRVSDAAGLARALQGAGPGTRILLQPGEYRGGVSILNCRGEAGRPVVIASADPANPARISGGGSGLHLSEVAHVELRDLVLTGATGNGLNIDDGGTPDTPSHHVTLQNLRVLDVGPEGNRDGIKLSGLDDFRVENCTVERWGEGGSAIDMVGCHRGMVEGCTFRYGRASERGEGNGVQAKGGSSEITIRRNRFEQGGRGVNLGGSTGKPYFRPPGANYEARDLRVEGNTFSGIMAPICYASVDRATVRFNTLYLPGRWALRILQENRAPGLIPCQDGVFEDNIVVFRSNQWASGGVNVGGGTRPDTFRFARNVWFCVDRPELSRPLLPTPETDGILGKDPLLQDPAAGDFRLQPGSPAADKGSTGLK